MYSTLGRYSLAEEGRGGEMGGGGHISDSRGGGGGTLATRVRTRKNERVRIALALKIHYAIVSSFPRPSTMAEET